MRLVALFLVAAFVVLAGCRNSMQPTTASGDAASKPVPSQPHPTDAAAPVAAIPPPATPSKPRAARSMQQIAQLDLNSEGGVRDGSYAMWVHVVHAGTPVRNLNVIAFDENHKAVAAARTNEDGDAMLKVRVTSYRITATRGHEHAEQDVVFHPGDQFELDLKH